MNTISKARIKYMTALHLQKYRKEYKAYLVEADKNVREWLMNDNTKIDFIVALPEWIENNAELLQEHPHLEVIIAQTHDLQKVSALSRANSVIAVVRMPEKQNEININTKGWTIMLERLQDPGNMGTIVRIADWFGIQQIICSNDSVEIYNPKVIQASMGSLLRVKVNYCELKKILHIYNQVPIYATTLDGNDMRRIETLSPGILLMGNESKGISEELSNMATKKICIPRIGKAESLNVAVATAVLCSKYLL